MDERYIIAPAALKAELFGAELNAVSAHGLLEHVLEPMIHCRTCEGILEEYAKETGGDLDKRICRRHPLGAGTQAGKGAEMNENELHLWLELLSQMTEEEKAQFLELLKQLARL